MHDRPTGANAKHGHIYGHKFYSYATTALVQPIHDNNRFDTNKPWRRVPPDHGHDRMPDMVNPWPAASNADIVAAVILLFY